MNSDERKDRLKRAIDYLVSTKMIDGKNIVKTISEKVDRHPNNIRAALRGDEKYLTQKFIKTFCTNFENVISPDWIWDGTGNILQNIDFQPKMKMLPSDTITSKESRNQKMKPRLPSVTLAGPLSDYLDGVMSYHCDYLPIIHQIPSYDFTMIIKGNSMEPKYEGGDEIACKQVFDYIEWGKTYVLATNDGAIVKRIYDAGDKVKCVSYNSEEYPEFYIEKSSILGYYKVVGLIRI